MISEEESKKYLKIIYDLKDSHCFYDMHAHPFEIIYNECNYCKLRKATNVYSTGTFDFHSPKVSDFMTDLCVRNNRAASLFETPAILKKKILNQYSHTGIGIFEKHMNISGISRILLLSVASVNKSIDSQMSDMEMMFGSDDRFLFGWSVPRNIATADIYLSGMKAQSKFSIKAIKFHPNITGVDLNSNDGRDRTQAILEVARDLKLPLIVHGGVSPILENKEASSYATLKNLVNIDWGISNSPVIIAHGGLFGYRSDNIDFEDIKRIKKLLSKHSHCYIDLSGLNIGAISLLLKHINYDRIVFGSDMLYEAQWQMVVKALYVIDKTTKRLEETFIKFSKTNPEKCLNL